MEVRYLSTVAASAAPPSRRGNRAHLVVLPACDGWKVCFYYDGRGDFGYLERFLSPEGDIIEPWTLPETDRRAGLRLWAPESVTIH